MNLLNAGDYYNRKGNYSSNGLTEEAKTQITVAKWYLGGVSDNENTTATQFYNLERRTEVYNNHSNCWIGKVGLIYPSDHGYATNGYGGTNREICFAKALFSWNSSIGSNCRNKIDYMKVVIINGH